MWPSKNRTDVGRIVLSAAVAACLLASCGGGLEPQRLRLDEDICSRCRMAISEKRYAAQAVQPSGAAFFDDIGCLAAWLHENRTNPSTALFVADYHSRQWVPVEEAVFVRSPGVPTPMGYATAAFADSAEARQWNQEMHGRVLTWQQFLREVEP